MPVTWMDHNGKRVLYIDVRQASGKQFVAEMDVSMEMLWAQSDKVPYLANIEDATVSTEVMQWIRKHGPNNAKRMSKLAVVGVTGVKKVFMDAVEVIFSKVAVPARSFKTEQDALEWLVKEDEKRHRG